MRRRSCWSSSRSRPDPRLAPPSLEKLRYMSGSLHAAMFIVMVTVVLACSRRSAPVLPARLKLPQPDPLVVVVVVPEGAVVLVVLVDVVADGPARRCRGSGSPTPAGCVNRR